MICSICINTYKRPQLLKKLLISISNQILSENIQLEVIVVENDTAMFSKNIIDEIQNEHKLPIKYFIQPEKNIALTRNKAVAEATGDYIFFIDDDEFASPDWVEKSINCLNKYNADGIFGIVRSYFEPSTPEWIQNNRIFHRIIQDSGSEARFTRTSNCLIKKEILKSIDGPFDTKYGITGGSDSNLFNKLIINGAKFISCTESVVYEYIPPERANKKWMKMRMLRTGNSFARRTIELSNSKILTRFFLTLKALIVIFLNLALFTINIYSKTKRNQYYIGLFSYIGHLLAIFNYHYEEYK
jgi:succinoglycan biosynthesis protein ExoM